MKELGFSQWLMLSGLGMFFIAYFAQLWRKHLAARNMIMNRDLRLYPPNYDELTKADRRRLLRIHTWQAVWDTTGKALTLVAALGVLLFVSSIFLATSRA
ncbi:MAG: hypothetical protein KDJ48_06455 [Nitratireductor sp.]|nr:hypothetical protein [Nitratireductor sp.]MCB1458890.1 hypothetical protein [Nitratireductor sp.]